MLSKTGTLAARALAQLPGPAEGRFIGANELAAAIDAPQNYLSKLLQQLARAGLIESRKGAGGGFRLARDPSSISLFDVVGSFERIAEWDGCFLGPGRCSTDSPCAVHDRWAELRDSYLRLLHETSIADLTRGGAPPDPDR